MNRPVVTQQTEDSTRDAPHPRTACPAIEDIVADWARHIRPDTRLAVLGCGTVGRRIATAFAGRGMHPQAFFDDYSTDTVVRHIPVLPLSRLAGMDIDVLVLATTRSRARMRQSLRGLPVSPLTLALPGADNDPFFTEQANSATPARSIRPFRDIHRNAPAFVVGNGPSLLKTDPRQIKHAVTFGCNSIFLLDGFIPQYYCVEDALVAQDRAPTINALSWAKFFPNDLRQWLDNGNFFNAHRVSLVDRFTEDFAAGIQVNATVTYTMLQLAFYMGCDPVYLIGIDHSYRVDAAQANRDRNVLTSRTDDPNHFHPDYFGKGLRWHDPRTDRMEAAYNLARTAYERNGRRVYNATAGGLLEVFDRIPFQRALEDAGR